MGFRFSLKALLRVRGIYERRERQRLESIARRLVYAQRQLAALRKRKLEETGSLAKGLEAGMSGAELHFQTACFTAHERLCNMAAQAVEDLRKQHQGQLAVYQRVRKDLEVIERLRERQLYAYRKNQVRKDQQQANDLFLVRYQTVNAGQELPGQPANLSSDEEA